MRTPPLLLPFSSAHGETPFTEATRLIGAIRVMGKVTAATIVRG